MLMVVAVFSSCSDDEKYAKDNTAYIQQKMLEKGADGELLYKQIEIGGQIALYRIIKKEGNATSSPLLDTKVTMTLKGNLINGKNFQPEMEMTFAPKELIPGLAYIMVKTCIGETVEAILPSFLGYGSNDNGPIPGGSTLIFTYTMSAYK